MLSPLQEASDKLCPPSTCMEFIGITFDTVTSTISIPANKIAEIMALVRTWQGRSCATKHQLQSLLGKLHHVSKCVKPARLFVSRMLDTLRSVPDRGRVALNADFQRDLQWFANFLPTYNGRNMMQYVGLSTMDLILEVDACLTGIGGIFHNEFYFTPIPTDIPLCQYHITHLEFLNILIALKLEATFYWPPRLRTLWQYGMCLCVEYWSIKGPILTEVCVRNLAASPVIWLQYFCSARYLPG